MLRTVRHKLSRLESGNTLFGACMTIMLRNHSVSSGVAIVNKEMFNICLSFAKEMKWALPFPISFVVNNLVSIEIKGVHIPASAFAVCNGLLSLSIPKCWISVGEELNFTGRVEYLNMTDTQRIHRVNDNIKTLIAGHSDLKKLPFNATTLCIDWCTIDYSGRLPTGLIGIKCENPSIDLMDLIRSNAASLTAISIPSSRYVLGDTPFPKLVQYDYSFGAGGLPNAPGLRKLACKDMHPKYDRFPPTKQQLGNYPALEWLDIYGCELGVYLEDAPDRFPAVRFLQLDMERDRHLLVLLLPRICPCIMVCPDCEFVVVDPAATVLGDDAGRSVRDWIKRIENGGGWFMDEFDYGDDDTGIVFFPN